MGAIRAVVLCVAGPWLFFMGFSFLLEDLQLVRAEAEVIAVDVSTDRGVNDHTRARWEAIVRFTTDEGAVVTERLERSRTRDEPGDRVRVRYDRTDPSSVARGEVWYFELALGCVGAVMTPFGVVLLRRQFRPGPTADTTAGEPSAGHQNFQAESPGSRDEEG
ncbi:hypothetical protein A6A25_31085 [Saccharothrix sp. CB00851]|nr:hypothetical protein A6A25_31085 [Saccharothrix sp. CB00851]